MCLPCVPGDSDKLNYIRRFHLRCKPIFATASAASKMQLTAKMVKSDPNHLASFIKVKSNSLIHSVERRTEKAFSALISVCCCFESKSKVI